jgi:uncharacterized protein (TIGR00730 family)
MSDLLGNQDTIRASIDQFISQFGDFKHTEELNHSIWSLLRFYELQGSPSDCRMMTTVIKEIRKTRQVFGRYSDHRKVCVFGSARTPQDHIDFQMAESFSQAITKKGFMIITGAGGGIMEACNKGSELNMSFGLNINLPFEQDPNPYIASSPKLIDYHYFFIRKLAFIRESDATVLFPGGFGTHDEGFENLTLTQTGRCAPRPLVMIASPDSTYWTTWHQMIQTELLGRELVSPDDMHLYKVVDNVQDAIEEITQFYRVYHSIRYLPNYTVMRLETQLSSELIDEINQTFKHLLLEGSFTQTSAAEIQEEVQLYPDKPRLVFHFNRREYGTLHHLIRRINQG